MAIFTEKMHNKMGNICPTLERILDKYNCEVNFFSTNRNVRAWILKDGIQLGVAEIKPHFLECKRFDPELLAFKGVKQFGKEDEDEAIRWIILPYIKMEAMSALKKLMAKLEPYGLSVERSSRTDWFKLYNYFETQGDCNERV